MVNERKYAKALSSKTGLDKNEEIQRLKTYKYVFSHIEEDRWWVGQG